MNPHWQCIVVMAGILLGETAFTAEQQPALPPSLSPITVRPAAKRSYATFTHRQQPTDRIGYRFFEHRPLSWGTIPEASEGPPATTIVNDLVDDFSRRSGVLVHQQDVRGGKGWIDQHWTFYLAPVEDGVDMLWVITTKDEGLPEYYGVQQCFRMSGKVNQAAWRHQIADSPSFSEFDLWSAQQGQEPKRSLTYVLRGGAWHTLPATKMCVGARTPLGLKIDERRFPDALPQTVGPYKAKMLVPIDHGLITRTNLEGTWICGIFWQRTSHVTNHHPADCLHEIVNIGDMSPNSKRAIRGKIYWFKGTKTDLLEHWRKDFGNGQIGGSECPRVWPR